MLVSIVTINRNTGTTIARTIESILSQRDAAWQWIVVDGASTDESVQLLRQAVRPGDAFVSEPDRGIADAMNKGLERATGDAVIFMNAGDEFAGPDTIAKLLRIWDRTRFRWIVGAGDILREDGIVLFTRSYASTPADPLSLVRTNCRIMHQAVLAERSLFEEHGVFDTSFRIAMDYELWIRWLTRSIIPQMTEHRVCRFWRGGASGSPIKNHNENRRAREKHGIANGPIAENALGLLARLKGVVGGRYGRSLYRLKERLGIKI